MAGLCREATKTTLQLALAEKEAAEKAAHNYKANPVPANLHHKRELALPEPHLTVSSNTILLVLSHPVDSLSQHLQWGCFALPCNLRTDA